MRNHISSIFAKLQVADRAQAIVRAREAGLGHQDAVVPAVLPAVAYRNPGPFWEHAPVPVGQAGGDAHASSVAHAHQSGVWPRRRPR